MEPDADHAFLEVVLAAAQTHLMTTLVGTDGQDRGACFVLIERLGDTP